MATEDSSGSSPGAAKRAGESLYQGTLDVVMTGVAIIVPLVITLYVFGMVLDFITNALVPFVAFLE